MPLTKPGDYQPKAVTDPRDVEHSFSPKTAPLKVFLKPLSQKVVEKHLWPEVILTLTIGVITLAVIFGREVPSALFFMLGGLFTAVIYRFIHVEDETHRKYSEESQSTPEEVK